MIDIGYWDEWKEAFNHRLKARLSNVDCYIYAFKKQHKTNRFIQFSSTYGKNFDTKEVNTGIHYEYYDGNLYLHIEDFKLKNIANFLRTKTRGNSSYKWERNNWGIIGHCRKDVHIDNEEQLFRELEDMMNFFNSLLDDYQVAHGDNPYTKKCDFKDWESDNNEEVSCCHIRLKYLMSYNLTIPDYQRDYCWEDEQLLSLYESIKDINDTTEYHLGTIILHNTDKNLNIIDGQQRLVTLSLLLRELGYDGQLPLLLQKFQSKNATNHVANTKYVYRNLFSINHIDRKKLANKLAESLTFSVLVLQKNNLDLAYTFFSNQNSRGVPLTDYDILKAHHLRYIPVNTSAEYAQAEHLVKRWNELTAEGNGCSERNDLSVTLGTHLYRLRQWMRCNNFDESAKWKVKKEFSAAPSMPNIPIPPFREIFLYDEKIQGGTYFFKYADKFVNEYCKFKQTHQFIALNKFVNWGAHRRYADVIETLLFAYYLKFGTEYLSEALYGISSIMAAHRYANARSIMNKILDWASKSKIVLMIDQASSPSFFLAEIISQIGKSRLDFVGNDIRIQFWTCLGKMFSSLNDYQDKSIYEQINEEYEI